VEESGAAEAYADPARIRQVVDNLMANAVKFNRDGGRVTASTSTDGVHTTVRVADTGIGMAPMRPRECSSGSSEPPSVPGNGLGLTITRDLVAAHGGSIAVESTAGRERLHRGAAGDARGLRAGGVRWTPARTCRAHREG
jgi:signal transduction histidine kinase